MREHLNIKNKKYIRLCKTSYPFHSGIDALESLKSLCHKNVGELFMNTLHFVSDLQNPLLVRIRSKVIRGSTVSKFRVTKELKIIRGLNK